MTKSHFGVWLLSQANNPISSDITQRVIRRLARECLDDDTFPMHSVTYGAYERWIHHHYVERGEQEDAVKALKLVWEAWEKLPNT